MALRIWNRHSRSVLSGMHLIFSCAGVILPVISAPYLMEQDNANLITDMVSNHTYSNMTHLDSNNTISYLNRNNTTQIYAIYFVIGIYVLIVATFLTVILMLTGTIYYRKRQKGKQVIYTEILLEDYSSNDSRPEHSLNEQVEDHKRSTCFPCTQISNKSNSIPTVNVKDVDEKQHSTKGTSCCCTSKLIQKVFGSAPYIHHRNCSYIWIIQILFLFPVMCLGGREMVYIGLVYTYSTESLKLSVETSTLILSVHFICYSISRLTSLFSLKHFTPYRHVLFGLTINCILLLSASFVDIFFFDNIPLRVFMIWTTACLTGFTIAPIFSCIVLWADSIFTFTPFYTSVYIIANIFGFTVWPASALYFMETLSQSWFSHMTSITSLCLLFGCLITRRVQCSTNLTSKANIQLPTEEPTIKNNFLTTSRNEYSSSLHSIHAI